MAIKPLTQAELLDVWRRNFPDDYTIPIEQESGGQGLDVFSQQAAQFARVAEAINTSQQATYIKPHSTQTASSATGGVKATGQATIRRAAPFAGDILLAQGTFMTSSQRDARGESVFGPRFEFVSDVTFPAGGVSEIVVDLIATREGFQSNLFADRVNAFQLLGSAQILNALVPVNANAIVDTDIADRFSSLMLGRYIRFDTGPNATTTPRRIVDYIPNGDLGVVTVDGDALTAGFGDVSVLEYSDLGLSVVSSTPMTGGRAATLDALGAERRVGRVEGELDADYSNRICTIGDKVTPGAVQRAVSRILTPLGIPFRIKETRDLNGLPGVFADFDFFDLGSLADGKLLLRTGCGDVRYFAVCIGQGTQGNFGDFYDDTGSQTAFWDLAIADGVASEFIEAVGELDAVLNQIRAAGVCYDIFIDPDL